MYAVIIANHKKLLFSVGFLCLSYPAFGMEEQVKSEFQWPSQKKKLQQQNLMIAKSSHQQQFKLAQNTSRQTLRTSRHFSPDSMPLLSPRDTSISSECSLSSRQQSSSSSISLSSPRKLYLSPREKRPSTSPAKTLPREEKEYKQHVDEEIGQKFAQMQKCYDPKSMEHLLWLRYLFYSEIKRTPQLVVPTKLTGENIGHMKAKKLLNNFWDLKVTKLLSNPDSLPKVGLETLQLLADSIKFLCDTIESMELTVYEVEAKERNASFALELKERNASDDVEPKERNANQKKTGSEAEPEETRPKNLYKILSNPKIENGLSKKLSKYKLQNSPGKILSKTASKSKLEPSYIEKLDGIAKACYVELANRYIELTDKFILKQEYPYNAAKYLSYAGKFDETLFIEAWGYMSKCTMFSDYIHEDYKKDLRWINLLKGTKTRNLMKLSMHQPSKKDNLVMARDYLVVAQLEAKLNEIENQNSNLSQEVKDSMEETGYIYFYIEGLKYYHLDDPALCFLKMEALHPYILAVLAPKARALADQDVQYKKPFLAISHKAYEYLLIEYMKRADQGNPDAEFMLGAMHEEGLGTPQDPVNAMRFYKRAVAKNHENAKVALEKMYKENRGIPKDPEKALEYYKTRADKQDDTESQFSLGEMYDKGLGTAANGEEAAKYYKLAAGKGHVLAQHCLATLFEEGFGVPKDGTLAFFWHQEAARGGNISSQDMLGWMYEEGYGVPKDLNEAFRWYSIAAKKGEEHSQQSLIKMYENGQGTQINPEEAAHWCRVVAEREIAPAQFKLAVFFKDGFGVPINKREAFKWCEKSANKGNTEAILLLRQMYITGYVAAPIDKEEAHLWHTKAFRVYEAGAEAGDQGASLKLAEAYVHGLGVSKNEKEAVKIYEDLAEFKNNAFAQVQLGWICSNGSFGLEINMERAIKLFEKSAAQENPDACFALGCIYEDKQDKVKAIEYYQKAAKNGDSSAGDQVKRIEEKMRGNKGIDSSMAPY